MKGMGTGSRDGLQQEAATGTSKGTRKRLLPAVWPGAWLAPGQSFPLCVGCGETWEY